MLQDNGFIKDKRLFLLDIDGTVCIGQRLIDGTREFLKAVKNSGGQFVFITNNSTRSIEDYILSFQKLGVMTDYTNFVTASFATVQYLKKHYDGKLIYVMGTKSLIRELKKNKIRVTTDCMDEDIACVLVKPIYLGKPGTAMVDYALKLNHFSREETLVVGDRLYTDILCGHNAGVETALVLTGEATREEGEACEYGPDYIFSSIAELYREWK